ncbi:MAG: substrate-binding domain-containing protein [Candidatus Electrothrix sp. YB6]
MFRCTVQFVFVFLLCCTAAGSLQAGEEQEKKEKVIAFAQDTLANDFRRAQIVEVRDALAEHAGIKFVYSDAKGQTSLLIWHIEQFIADQVDLLILGTNDPDAVVPVVTKAYDLGIPVIILDRGISGEKYTCFINSDNLRIGAIGAEYTAGLINGRGTVLLLEGLPKADVTRLRTRAFLDVISKYPDIKMIRRTGNYLRKDTIFIMEKLLTLGIQFDAVFSQSDSMLSGVRSAMTRHGLDPSKIFMTGCDYTSEAQEAIRNGTQTASILFPLGGRKTVEVALKILNGEEVPKHISLPVRLVTKDDVDQVSPIF